MVKKTVLFTDDDVVAAGNLHHALVAQRQHKAEGEKLSPLAEIRKATNMSQQQMAAALGLGLRTYQEQESSDEPREVYVMAAREFERRYRLSSIDTTKPLPDSDDEAKAQFNANATLVSLMLETLMKFSSEAEAHLLASAARLQSQAVDSGDPHTDMIDRRAKHVARSTIEWVHLFS